MADIAEVFGLDELAVEDARQRRRSGRRSSGTATMTFLVLRTARYVEHAELTETSEVVETGDVMIFIGEQFVITVRHGALGALGPVRADLEAQPRAAGRRARGRWRYAVCDRVVDTYLEVAAAVEDDIDALEEQVFARAAHGRHRADLPAQAGAGGVQAGGRCRCSGRWPRWSTDKPSSCPRRSAATSATSTTTCSASVEQVIVATTTCSTRSCRPGWPRSPSTRTTTCARSPPGPPSRPLQTAIAGIYGMNFDYMPELRLALRLPGRAAGHARLRRRRCYRLFRRSGWL